MNSKEEIAKIKDGNVRELLEKRLQLLKHHLKFRNKKHCDKLINDIIKEFC